MLNFYRKGIVSLAIGLISGTAAAQEQPVGEFTWFDQGKLAATGAVSTIEGSAGAGLSTWALITGYGTDNSIGVTGHATVSPLSDFTFRSYGAAVGVMDRFEFSLSEQQFDTGSTGPLLGLPDGFEFKQQIAGVKVKLLGNAVFDQDKWFPQIAAGLQYKKADHAGLLGALGADDDSSVDYYLAMTKIMLDKSIIVNATARYTEANQYGLLGFGSAGKGHSLQGEFSLAYLLSHNFLIGGDYRTKPDNLAFAKEQNAKALYAAWFPSKHISLTAAYVDLGAIALQGRQTGYYVSLQVAY